VGVGLIGFANLNRHQSFGGVMLALGVGQLR
jgi:SAM-dependent methyltransferase